MRNIKILLILAITATITLFNACDDAIDDLVTSEATTGALIDVEQTSLSYVIGNDSDYKVNVKVFQNAENVVNSLDVYKTYTDSLGTTDRILLKNYPVASQNTEIVAMAFSPTELKADVVRADGSPIPASDGDLVIGDNWALSYEIIMSDRTLASTAGTSITVSTRFAGTYEVIASDYYRIGVQSGAANWVGETREIKSVNSTDYYHEGFGPFSLGDFGGADEFFYFKIDDDGVIDYYQEYNGEIVDGLGSILITCNTNPNDMVNVPCDGSDYVQKDDVNGQDILYMTYGYYTDGSGPREFYEVLKKIN